MLTLVGTKTAGVSSSVSGVVSSVSEVEPDTSPAC